MPSYYAVLNMNKLEIRNQVVHVLASAPGSPVEGQIYYDSVTKLMYFRSDVAWVPTAAGTAPDASTSTKGVTKMSVAPASGVNPIAVGDNDARVVADQVAGTASIRTLGTGAQQAMAGSTRLDTIAAPTGSLALNSQKITGLADGTAATDAATKGQVDALLAGVDHKASVRLATTANGALATAFANGQTIDGTALVTGDRILLKNQTAPAENGIYTVNASGAPTRATDFDTWAEIPGSLVSVEIGTANADSVWLSTADAGGTLNTTGITFIKMFNNPADLTNVTGTLAIASGGTGQTTAKLARESGLITGGYYSSATHGAGTTISISAATHGQRASRGLIIGLLVEATGEVINADIVIASNGDVTVTFAVSQSANTIRVTIMG